MQGMRTGYLLLFGIQYLDFSHKGRNGRKKGRHSRLSPSRQAQTGTCDCFRGVPSIDSFTPADHSRKEGSCGKRAPPVLFTQRIAGITISFPRQCHWASHRCSTSQRHSAPKTSFPRRESSPGGDRPVQISPPADCPALCILSSRLLPIF